MPCPAHVVTPGPEFSASPLGSSLDDAMVRDPRSKLARCFWIPSCVLFSGAWRWRARMLRESMFQDGREGSTREGGRKGGREGEKEGGWGGIKGGWERRGCAPCSGLPLAA
eukprot:1128033-Rhodomonas_salina.3